MDTSKLRWYRTEIQHAQISACGFYTRENMMAALKRAGSRLVKVPLAMYGGMLYFHQFAPAVGARSKFQGWTVCRLNVAGKSFVSLAVCSPDDKWDSGRGCQIAAGRSLHQWARWVVEQSPNSIFRTLEPTTLQGSLDRFWTDYVAWDRMTPKDEGPIPGPSEPMTFTVNFCPDPPLSERVSKAMTLAQDLQSAVRALGMVADVSLSIGPLKSQDRAQGTDMDPNPG